MSVVREQIDAGLSDEQIIDGLLASYTDSQRLDPEVSAATIALWLVPGIALAGGIVLGLRELRRRPGRPQPSKPPSGAMEET